MAKYAIVELVSMAEPVMMYTWIDIENIFVMLNLETSEGYACF